MDTYFTKFAVEIGAFSFSSSITIGPIEVESFTFGAAAFMAASQAGVRDWADAARGRTSASAPTSTRLFMVFASWELIIMTSGARAYRASTLDPSAWVPAFAGTQSAAGPAGPVADPGFAAPAFALKMSFASDSFTCALVLVLSSWSARSYALLASCA